MKTYIIIYLIILVVLLLITLFILLIKNNKKRKKINLLKLEVTPLKQSRNLIDLFVDVNQSFKLGKINNDDVEFIYNSIRTMKDYEIVYMVNTFETSDIINNMESLAIMSKHYFIEKHKVDQEQEKGVIINGGVAGPGKQTHFLVDKNPYVINQDYLMYQSQFTFNVADMVHGMSRFYSEEYPVFANILSTLGALYRVKKSFTLTLNEVLLDDRIRVLVNSDFKNILEEFPLLREMTFDEIIGFIDRASHNLSPELKEKEVIREALNMVNINQ